MLLQLNPPLPLKTPKGSGLAHFLIDYGPETDLYWVVFLDTGEVWTYSNFLVRAEKNITLGRIPDKPKQSMECSTPIPDKNVINTAKESPIRPKQPNKLADNAIVYIRYPTGEVDLS